ncbi:hypothetical protein [Devosia sp. Root105]|uniref:hypothetical protein n=1 Tax=Devosia sp. Root105 TaxID=1736423 RepID=UPI0006F47B2B|nr:hypothetical protein [Devosia sp. Root105]KQV08673.1 hypothetical protein ASC68_25475 [Devosia sp. Root105]
MSEIKDRQDAASDIDPIVAALADDTQAAAAVEGFEAAEPVDAEAMPVAGVEALLGPEADTVELSDSAVSDADEPLAAADLDDVVEGEPIPQSGETVYAATATDELVADAAVDFGDEAPAEAVGSADIADAIEAALLDAAPAPLAASAFEHMPAAYADTIVELDVEADSDDEAPLLDVDLEDGIASVFAALHAAQQDSAPVEPLGDLEAADGVTFRLLGELDRLWHRAA